MASQEVLTALETLHREIEKLKPAVQHVELAQQVSEMVSGIPKMHLDLIEEVLKTDSHFKNGLQKICEKELTELTAENKKLQKTTSEIQQHVKLEQDALAKLKETVQSFHERVEKINFPERLDKLDANIAGIMAAIQSVQSRLDALDRSMSDRSREILDHQKIAIQTLQHLVEKGHKDVDLAINRLSKKQRTIAYITWGLIVVSFMLILFPKKILSLLI